LGFADAWVNLQRNVDKTACLFWRMFLHYYLVKRNIHINIISP